MRLNTLTNFAKSSPLLRRLLYPALALRQRLHKNQRAIQDDLFQSLCTLLAHDPVIHAPDFQGTFVMDCRSDLFKRLVLEKYYEPQLVQHCISRINRHRDVIDVGANIGMFTVLFAKLLETGRVLSIEPTSRALSRLHKNIALNCVQDKVLVFEGAATNRRGQVEIKSVEGKEEYSSLGEMKHPSIATAPHGREIVSAATIDDLVERLSLDPGFIKVDVEGAEHMVFEGAQEVLGKARPVILSELSDYLLKQNGSSAAEVVNMITASRYDVIDPIDPGVPPGRKRFGDILCLPR